MNGECIKILIVNTVPTTRNGVTNVIMNYLTSIDMNGLVVDYLSLNQADQMYIDKIRLKGGRFYVLPRIPGKIVSYWTSLRRLVKDNAYDIVHIHGNSHTLVLELSAVRLAGCKVRMIHSHNTTCKYPITHKLLTPIFNLLCTDGLACGVNAGKYMFGSKPFKVLNNGVDTKRFAFNEKQREATRKLLGWENNHVIGHVGVFNEQKNHRFIVDIFEQLYHKDNKYRLLLVGDGSLRKVIENKVKEKGLEDSVYFTGNTDNVEDYLDAMDLLVMPSLYEGLPLALIEQQANGLLCVLSDTITKEVDKTGNLYFLSLNDSPAQWANFIDDKICDNFRKKKSITAIEDIKRCGYDINSEAQKLKEYYLQAIENK